MAMHLVCRVNGAWVTAQISTSAVVLWYGDASFARPYEVYVSNVVFSWGYSSGKLDVPFDAVSRHA